MPSKPASTSKPPLNIVLCSPRGFCAGVVRAIDTVERALAIVVLVVPTSRMICASFSSG